LNECHNQRHLIIDRSNHSIIAASTTTAATALLPLPPTNITVTVTITSSSNIIGELSQQHQTQQPKPLSLLSGGKASCSATTTATTPVGASICVSLSRPSLPSLSSKRSINQIEVIHQNQERIMLQVIKSKNRRRLRRKRNPLMKNVDVIKPGNHIISLSLSLSLSYQLSCSCVTVRGD
jgi:hypothetical protein